MKRGRRRAGWDLLLIACVGIAIPEFGLGLLPPLIGPTVLLPLDMHIVLGTAAVVIGIDVVSLIRAQPISRRRRQALALLTAATAGALAVLVGRSPLFPPADQPPGIMLLTGLLAATWGAYYMSCWAMEGVASTEGACSGTDAR